MLQRAEAFEIASLGKVKCQHKVRKLEDINQWVCSWFHFCHGVDILISTSQNFLRFGRRKGGRKNSHQAVNCHCTEPLYETQGLVYFWVCTLFCLAWLQSNGVHIFTTFSFTFVDQQVIEWMFLAGICIDGGTPKFTHLFYWILTLPALTAGCKEIFRISYRKRPPQ